MSRHFIRPEVRRILSMHPYKPIDANADGTGGGITLRVSGARDESYMVDVVWGETTEIDVTDHSRPEGDA